MTIYFDLSTYFFEVAKKKSKPEHSKGSIFLFEDDLSVEPLFYVIRFLQHLGKIFVNSEPHGHQINPIGHIFQISLIKLGG